MKSTDPQSLKLGAALYLLTGMLACSAPQGGAPKEGHSQVSQTQTWAAQDLRTAFFDINKIQKFELWMDQWDQLKTQQPKGGRCNFAFMGEHFDTFKAPLVKVNGFEFKNVALKKSSFCGSLSDTKPNLKVNFGKFDQTTKSLALGALGTGELILKNSVQDQSLLRQCLAAEILTKAGFPKQLCNFIEVWANDSKIGLYVNLEPTDQKFLSRHYGQNLGNLYEVAGEELDDWAITRFKDRLDSYKNPEDKSLGDMKKLIAALKTDGSRDLRDLGQVLDLEKFIRYWAMEIILVHWDGFANNINNSFIYFRSGDGKAEMIARGMDQVLTDYPDPKGSGKPVTQLFFVTHSLTKKLWANPIYQAKLKDTVNELLSTVWDEKALLARIDVLSRYPQSHVPGWELNAEPKWSFERLKSVISKRRSDISEMWKFAAAAGENLGTASGFPLCKDPSSDPDRDGWGWENGQSCRVQ